MQENQAAGTEESSQAKFSFLARMSHEMRTPLNAILGMTTIAQSSIEDPEKVIHCLSKINEASLHLLGMINDILDMSRIESGKLEFHSAEFDFEEMIKGIISSMQFSMNEKKQNFKLFLDPSLPRTVISDQKSLIQVITNLLGNAIKFTPAEGNISLKVKKLAEGDGSCTLKLDVADSGIGISPEAKEKLYALFEQADGSIDRKFEGIGLGLAITKSILDLMGGDISVQSEQGRGTCFTVKFAVEMVKAKEPEAVKAGAIFTGRCLLLAEDVEINREIIISLLEDTGIAIECAKNGIQALSMFEAAPSKYSIILMDIHMPEMDGYETTRKIRHSAAEEAFSIPIVALTANVFNEDIEKCHKAGMNDHLGKPIVYNDLVKMLEKYLLSN
ncbi:ATP-binding protein [Leadbettera azotonutricia]|uniref:histidine kinase n=1 Tax=Leadbettera azotonutricia (strain ATCC BAA-888 / DSM 13862 / ZAS-9) TaxID=545695 RepID=F5Y8F8_LEAAZ|nr:ATP-binding protein [Leadbettera azotonutricia]AEF80543.1 PAS domain protein [Leadbettera azotonutricia ZAS-9]